MVDDLTKGKLLTQAAIATLIAAAWWLGESVPVPGVSRWLGVPLALLLAAYLHWGYRRFNWIVGIALIVTGGGGAVHIANSSTSSTASGQVGQLLIAFAAIVVAPVLVLSRPVRSYLEYQRVRRPEAAWSILVAVWIVILTVTAVLVWTGVGTQVF